MIHTAPVTPTKPSSASRHSNYTLGQLGLNPSSCILVLGDDNVQHWPSMDRRFDQLHLRDVGLEDIPDIVVQLSDQLQHIRAIVIAAGSRTALINPTTCGHLTSIIKDLFASDGRIHLVALAEFEDADAAVASNIAWINRAARRQQSSRFIRITPSAAVDSTNSKKLIYGDKTGKIYYDSVAAFFSKIPIP